MMRCYPRYLMIGLLSLTLLSPVSMAGQKTKTYDRIQLSAEASMPVENDTLTAQLYAQREGSDLSQLADEVNRKISQAVQRVKQVEGVSLQTQGYQTYPVYQQQRVTGWRVRQSLRLESRDSAALSRLLGELQSGLALESLQYSVSPEQRQAAEEQLIGQAMPSSSAPPWLPKGWGAGNIGWWRCRSTTPASRLPPCGCAPASWRWRPPWRHPAWRQAARSSRLTSTVRSNCNSINNPH